jgi:hypothetical protein
MLSRRIFCFNVRFWIYRGWILDTTIAQLVQFVFILFGSVYNIPRGGSGHELWAATMHVRDLRRVWVVYIGILCGRDVSEGGRAIYE